MTPAKVKRKWPQPSGHLRGVTSHNGYGLSCRTPIGNASKNDWNADVSRLRHAAEWRRPNDQSHALHCIPFHGPRLATIASQPQCYSVPCCDWTLTFALLLLISDLYSYLAHNTPWFSILRQLGSRSDTLGNIPLASSNFDWHEAMIKLPAPFHCGQISNMDSLSSIF